MLNLNNTHWACDPVFLQEYINKLQNIFAQSAALDTSSEEPTKYTILGSTAVIPIHGVILKTIPKYYKYYGIQAASSVETRHAIEAASRDPNVKDIRLHIDSPGGDVSGLLELVASIKTSSKMKPITAKVDGLAASAAYWIASQANKIEATESSNIGSIGVYTVLYDFSKMYTDMGIKTVIVRSGEHKGVGTPGVEITANNINARQDIVDNLASQFISAVASGRRMEIDKIKPLADGRWWLAKEALDLGLIDSISNLSIKGNIMDENQFNALMQAVTGLTATVKNVAARVEELESDSKKTAAKADILEQGLKTSTENQKQALIASASSEGRVFAGNMEAINVFASKASVEELKSFLASLPKVTKDNVAADLPKETQQAESIGDALFAKAFRTSVKDIIAADNIVSVSADGMATLKDGSVKKLSEVM